MHMLFTANYLQREVIVCEKDEAVRSSSYVAMEEDWKDVRLKGRNKFDPVAKKAQLLCEAMEALAEEGQSLCWM